MIYDSEEQKAFIIQAVREFPCKFGVALDLANKFGSTIQRGEVIPEGKIVEFVDAPKKPKPPTIEEQK